MFRFDTQDGISLGGHGSFLIDYDYVQAGGSCYPNLYGRRMDSWSARWLCCRSCPELTVALCMVGQKTAVTVLLALLVHVRLALQAFVWLNVDETHEPAREVKRFSAAKSVLDLASSRPPFGLLVSLQRHCSSPALHSLASAPWDSRPKITSVSLR